MDHATRTVLAQRAVDGAPGEVPAFIPLLAGVDLAGVVVTADALHTHADAATFLVTGKQAHYLFPVKANQPLLLERCAGLAWHRVPVLDRTRDRGHGRVELRTLKAVSVRHFGFPHAAQVIQVTRKTRDLGGSTRRWRTVVVYAITSLPFGQASPARLADLIRGHWTIENGLHYPKLAIRRPGRCASLGADETILASISRPAGSRYQLLACLRGPGLAASERQVRQLLAATSVRG